MLAKSRDALPSSAAEAQSPVGSGALSGLGRRQYGNSRVLSGSVSWGCIGVQTELDGEDVIIRCKVLVKRREGVSQAKGKPALLRYIYTES